MLDVNLFRNLRFSAASGAVTITFFSLMGFIFLITLYFQFLKGYGPLETGLRLLPVAITVGITSVVGTGLAVRSGTKLVVAAGCSRSPRASRGRRPRARHRLHHDRRSDDLHRRRNRADQRPGDRSIMGAVSEAKAGIGSAVNDATRIIGGTLGVAVIGSIYASLYSSRLTDTLPAATPGGCRR